MVAASCAKAITACIDTSSPPAGIRPVNTVMAAVEPALSPWLPMSTNCEPMSPAAGSCDMESIAICVLLLCLCAPAAGEPAGPSALDNISILRSPRKVPKHFLTRPNQR